MKNPNRTAKENRRADGGDVADTIVVCSGKYGTSMQYAKWLAESLGCDGLGYDKKNLGYVSMYRNVIFIGAVRNGDIHMLNMLWQNYNNFGLDGRNIIICGVGIGDVDDPAYVNLLRRRNGCENQNNIDFYMLPGRIRRDRLKLLDRSVFNSFIEVEVYGLYDREEAERIVRRTADNYDGMSRDALEPVIRRIQELN